VDANHGKANKMTRFRPQMKGDLSSYLGEGKPAAIKQLERKGLTGQEIKTSKTTKQKKGDERN